MKNLNENVIFMYIFNYLIIIAAIIIILIWRVLREYVISKKKYIAWNRVNIFIATFALWKWYFYIFNFYNTILRINFKYVMRIKQIS